MRVVRISPGASFRDQISRTTRDLSRCEYIARGDIAVLYAAATRRLYACESDIRINNMNFFFVNRAFPTSRTLSHERANIFIIIESQRFIRSDLAAKFRSPAWIFLRQYPRHRNAITNKQAETDDTVVRSRKQVARLVSWFDQWWWWRQFHDRYARRMMIGPIKRVG